MLQKVCTLRALVSFVAVADGGVCCRLFVFSGDADDAVAAGVGVFVRDRREHQSDAAGARHGRRRAARSARTDRRSRAVPSDARLESARRGQSARAQPSRATTSGPVCIAVRRYYPTASLRVSRLICALFTLCHSILLSLPIHSIPCSLLLPPSFTRAVSDCLPIYSFVRLRPQFANETQ